MQKNDIALKKEKDATYRMLISSELVDQLYEKILHKFIVEKKYREPDYSAKQLAMDLGTNTRYISAVINLRFQQNYSKLVNEYRIREALYLLIDNRYLEYSIEEIARMVGFSNRQSFYLAFHRQKGCTPREFRKAQLEKKRKR